MLHVAIIGAGPAGFYTAEALAKRLGAVGRHPRRAADAVRADPRRRRPRSSVDQGGRPALSCRARRRRPLRRQRRGRDATSTLDELLGLYDAVVLATGAPHDRPLGIPGEDLPGVLGSAAFVGWYNGHPDFADLDVPLRAPRRRRRRQRQRRDRRAPGSSPRHRPSWPIPTSPPRPRRAGGERGARHPHRRPARAVPGELHAEGDGRTRPARRGRGRWCAAADLPDAARRRRARAGPAQGRRRRCAPSPPRRRADKPVTIAFDFFSRPVAIERRRRRAAADARADAAGGRGRRRHRRDVQRIDCGLIVACIGYLSAPLGPACRSTRRAARFVNDRGRVGGAAVRHRLGAARADGDDRHQPARRDRSRRAHRRRGRARRPRRRGRARRAARRARHPAGDLRRLAGDRRRRARRRRPPGTAREVRQPRGVAGCSARLETAVAPPRARGYSLAPCVGA